MPQSDPFIDSSINSPGRSIALFEREPATGLLSLIEVVTVLTDEVYDHIFLGSLALSPGGLQLVAGGFRALVVFERNQITGRLTLAEVTFAANLRVVGQAAPGPMAFAPNDSRHLYTVGRSDGAVMAIETSILFVDGFESGSTLAWSSE